MGTCFLPSYTKCTHTRTVYTNAATHTDKLEDAMMDDTNPNSNTCTHCCWMLPWQHTVSLANRGQKLRVTQRGQSTEPY